MKERRCAGRVLCLDGLKTLRAALTPGDAGRMGAAVACGLAASVFAAAAPVALKYLLDALTPDGAAQGPGQTFVAPAVLLAAYVGALLLSRLAGEARGVLFGFAEQSVSRALSRRAFAHVLALPMASHLSRSSGGVIQTLENGLQGYRLILQHGLFTLLPGLVEIGLVGLLILHFLDPVFLLVFGVCAAAYGLVFSSGARRVLRASRAVSAARIEANARLSDGLLNVETVKAYCGEAVISRRYDGRLAEAQGRWQQFYKARFGNGLLIALVFSAGLGTTLWLAAARVQSGALTVGDLVLINAWMLQLVRPLELLGFGIRDIGQGAAFVERLNDLLRETPEAASTDASKMPAFPGAPPSIRFENVSFSYANGRKVLDNVSFEIEAGKTTALVGPSGSGKSSILRLLMRFYEPEEGRILVNGAPLTDYPLGELRRRIALITQEPGLFDASLEFNMTFPEEGVARGDLEDAVRIAELGTLFGALPERRASDLGERGLRLSGGEKQRVAIARAFLKRTSILISDEATSSLDYPAEARIMENLARVSEGKTQLIVAHRLSAIASAHRVLILENGRISVMSSLEFKAVSNRVFEPDPVSRRAQS
ncbi:MAG: ABC transporter ATP-binding protein [Hyphomonas sp.]|uniref:ABC transporter ATP-binding protein n=1 Tax=Hyphomonas sp. TaxID=87 RepID=UPI00185AC6EE|nr:ABC transporter ATP-binding protein [Hyphomonas sp.]MBU3919510.1 ABC transporter ATP-binding protein/permease [Alphaproteobacteria bacterium]MBA3069115.1 ABC transporter ATP-binding protein [Hyphomonas sp.]MBU4061530.1 ABC transporter ATP-binding protein/permease [Alphaproteobacteria bacterium]MBU4165388.1 ABC transporter ATP-binding protein/permease [Alphaproteobacteria bacterium]MBU4569581.1 ABC transporter ATP-binding protein/permease [Alphaproteobacteria bacterium]